MSARVIWITGLSGTGKSTLAGALVARLRRDNPRVVLLDGDDLREAFGRVAGHEREDRLELAYGYGRLCRLLASQGFDVVIATISLFHEVHDWNRRHLPNYMEVYLKAPLDVLAGRDPKGIYNKARSGQLVNVAGVDLAVDEPSAPHIVLDHSVARDVERDVDEIQAYLKERANEN